MGSLKGHTKKGRGLCTVTGEDNEVPLSSVDFPNGIGITKINCDNLKCKHYECFYHVERIDKCTKVYLKNITWID
jgi:hypothetical protein